MMHPRDYTDLCRKARNLHEQGNSEEAYATLRDLLSGFGPFVSETAFALAWARETDRQLTEHIAVLYEYSAECSEQPAHKANAFFRAGWVLQQLGRQHDAEPLYEKALLWARNSTPDNTRSGAVNSEGAAMTRAHAAYWLAAALESKEEFLNAVELYDEAVQWDHGLYIEAMYRKFASYTRIFDFAGMRSAFFALRDASVPVGQEARKQELLDLAMPEYTLIPEEEAGK